VNFRTATLDDVPRLAAARWAFRTEDEGETPIEVEQAFARRYESFVRDGLHSRRWTYWIAETDDGEIVSHMAICVVQSIPRPSRETDQWGYLTDCYTRPLFRNKGIGQELLAHVTAWAKSRDLELLVVWPSEKAERFYSRAGFEHDDEIRVLRLRAYDAEEG
jgi:GNAT superfamily N-acetyltransferase